MKHHITHQLSKNSKALLHSKFRHHTYLHTGCVRRRLDNEAHDVLFNSCVQTGARQKALKKTKQKKKLSGFKSHQDNIAAKHDYATFKTALLFDSSSVNQLKSLDLAWTLTGIERGIPALTKAWVSLGLLTQKRAR